MHLRMGVFFVPSVAIAASLVIVHVGVVVDIGDVRNIRDMRVGDVHLVEVAAAHAVPGNVGLAKTQRAPAIAVSAAEANSYAPSPTAKPRHQGGSIVRTRVDRSRSPTPVIVVVNPAAVVERSIA